MRHIDFDDSLVLGEFARIAHENGWVKEAEEAVQIEGKKAGRFSTDAAAAVGHLAKAPAMYGMTGDVAKKFAEAAEALQSAIINLPDTLAPQEAANEVAKLLKVHLSDPSFAKVLSGMQMSIGMAAQKHGAELPAPSSGMEDMLKNIRKTPQSPLTPEMRGDITHREVGESVTPPPSVPERGPAPDVDLGPKKDIDVEQPAADASQSQNPLTRAMDKLSKFYARVLKRTNNDVAKANRVFDKQLKRVINSLRGRFGNHPEIKKFEIEAQKLKHEVKKSNMESDMTKSAKEDGGKHYDVTGETGEQLVEKAHPGGGTKTELTHSKTDENLVETIVEQQKKDLEVAHSVPKGTYAALVELYGRLHKMGHKKHLNNLKKMIQSVATPEEVMHHTLVSLADRLDNAGYRRAANKVDELIKAAGPYVDPGIAEYGGSWPMEDVGMTGPDATSTPVPTGIEYPGKEQGKPGDVPKPPLAPIPLKKRFNPARQIRNFQKRYNQIIKGHPLPPLAVDGIHGPKTRAALNQVKEVGGFRQLKKALERFMETGAPGYLPLEPIPTNPLPPAPPLPLAPPAMPNPKGKMSIEPKTSSKTEDGFVVTAPNGSDFFLGAAARHKSLNPEGLQKEAAADVSTKPIRDMLDRLDDIDIADSDETLGAWKNTFVAFVDELNSINQADVSADTEEEELQNINKAYGVVGKLLARLKKFRAKIQNLIDTEEINEWGTDDTDLVEAIGAAVSVYEPTYAKLTKFIEEKTPSAEETTPAEDEGKEGNVEPEEKAKKHRMRRGPEVTKFQTDFNAVVKGTPYEAGYTLKVDGIQGPKTNRARRLVKRYKGLEGLKAAIKRKTEEPAQQQKQPPAPPPPPAPPASPQAPRPNLRTYQSLYERAAQMFNSQVGSLAKYPAAQEVLRQEAKQWEENLKMNPNITDSEMNNYMTKYIRSLKTDLDRVESEPGRAQHRMTRQYK